MTDDETIIAELLDALEYAEGALLDYFASKDGLDIDAARGIASMLSELLKKHGRISVVDESGKQDAETTAIANAIDAEAVGLVVTKRLDEIFSFVFSRRANDIIARVVAAEIRKALATETPETSGKACACRGDHGAPEGSAGCKSDKKSADRLGEIMTVDK